MRHVSHQHGPPAALLLQLLVPEGLDVLLRGVHGRVVYGEHARAVLGSDRAEEVLAGAVGLLAQQEVEEGKLEDVVGDFDLASL